MGEPTVQDLIAAKDAQIESLTNELVMVRMQLAQARREAQELENQPDAQLDASTNGKVDHDTEEALTE